MTNVNTDDIRGTEIKAQAEAEGLDHVTQIAETGEGDDRITIYDFNGVLVADTNGGAFWKESDPWAFAALVDQRNTPTERLAQVAKRDAYMAEADESFPTNEFLGR